MGRKKIETIIQEKISPYSLNEKGKSDLAQLISRYPYGLLKECIDIGVGTYFRYDENGELTQESVDTFLNKLGGIAFNKSRSPLEQEVYYIKNKCKQRFSYWDDAKADDVLIRYISALKNAGWTNEQVIYDLKTDVNRMCSQSRNWSQWLSGMESWVNDILHWKDEDNVTIEQNESILPNAVVEGLSPNIQSLCKQINASYEHNLYDCTAVIMRRLLEGLLVVSYQNNGLEVDITDKNGRHFSLDKIIKNAEQNPNLSLSLNTRKDMNLFRELGNYSAHKIWFNSTQKDIEPHILKYRAIIEELIYKAGLK
jgi:hypothetical protein